MRALLVFVLLAGCGRIGFDPVCGLDGPCISAVTINGGALYAPGPRLAVGVTVTGDVPAADVRVTAGPCSFADDGWQPYDPATTYPVLVEPVDGAKQVCAWARDATGQVSLVKTATIRYETMNLPVVEAFDVAALDATHMRVTWTLSDVEGLATHPVDLEIMTGTTWDPLATGIGVGDATRVTGTIDLAAPPGPYVVRLTPSDRAGNRGIRAFSDLVGAPGWNVCAGSPDRGYGASGRAAQLQFAENSDYFYAVDPATLDAYAVDRDAGIIRVDGATGQTDVFLHFGTTNLPSDGPLPDGAAIDYDPALQFGPDGMLYVSAGTADDDRVSGVIYQIDPRTRHCRRYLGGGTVFDQTATPTTVFISKYTWTFDEDGAMYFVTSCTPGTISSPFRARLLKAQRQADGTAGAISVIAGNCATGNAPTGGPFDPLAVPLPAFRIYMGIASLAAFDHGRALYMASYPGVAAKVVDGQLYTSDLPISSAAAIEYDPVAGTILVARGGIEEFTPNRTGPTDPLVGTRVPESGTGACVADGAAVADACVHSGGVPQATADRVYFVDGPVLNELRGYRVRFVDRSGSVQTYLGSLSFHGEGLPARLVRSRIAGIAYKPASAPNQSAFPAGLYLTDPLAPALVRIDEQTNNASIVWGNQSATPRTIVAGDALGPDVSLGVSYIGGGLQALAIDDQGLPVLRYGPKAGRGALLTADSAGRAVPLQTAGQLIWENAPDGTDPAIIELWPYGTINNLSLAGTTAFLLGGYSQVVATATLHSLDFALHTTTRLMGSGADGYSADTTMPANASFSSSCHDTQYNCFTQYRATDDRLYFSENNRLRYLTTPRNPATSALGTLFSLGATVNIHNFTFRPDGSQVYYVSQGLRCHDLSSGQAYCNDTSLGPPGVAGPLGVGPDQLTWKDNNTLLISTYVGYVLQYTPP